jgi:hypothetical protein
MSSLTSIPMLSEREIRKPTIRVVKRDGVIVRLAKENVLSLEEENPEQS